MANVLAMPAREIRHPVALLVLVVAADRSLHEFSVPTQSAKAFGQPWCQELTVRQLRWAGNSDIGQR
jgi:hypothetical protein